MTRVVSDKLDAISALARKHGVARLSLFGSGLSNDFDRQQSDLDFSRKPKLLPRATSASAFYVIRYLAKW
jgi:predicted nucleotidyltransferase